MGAQEPIRGRQPTGQLQGRAGNEGPFSVLSRSQLLVLYHLYEGPENRLLVCEASQEKNSTRQLLGKTRVWHQSTRGSNEETTTEPCLPFPAPFASTRPWTPHLQPTISTIPTTSYRSNHDGRWRTQKLQGVWTGVHCRRAVQCHKGVGPGRLRYRVVCGRHAVIHGA